MWNKKYTLVQISIGKFYHMLIFEQGFSQPVSFWTRNFTACQVWTLNIHQVSQFGTKILQRVRFCTKKLQRVIFWFKSFTTCQILLQSFFPFVRFWFRINTMCLALKQKVYNVSFFESKLPYLVRFWIKIFTRCLILIDGNQKESDFDLKTSKSVGLWKKFLSKVHVGFFVQLNGHLLPPSWFSNAWFWNKTVFILSKFSWEKSQLVRF